MWLYQQFKESYLNNYPFVLDPDTGESCLHVAVSLNHEDIVQQVLQLGAGVKVQDNKGLTPVMTACQYGHLQSLEQLSTKGMDSAGW